MRTTTINNKRKPQPKASPKKRKAATRKPKRSTPFRDVGQTLGNFAGSIFDMPELGGSLGALLGTGIGSIFGSGDYKVSGPIPKYNVLQGQTPRFDSSKATNIVTHREYLGEIIGTAGFTNTVYPLQPGNAQTFPWLATLAQNYQEYRIHGMMFEFRSEITDFVTSGQPGYVTMSTNYNAVAPAYATKQQLENSEYAVSTKPTCNLVHMVECAVPQTVIPEKYIRDGPVPAGADARMYDLGNFQIATGGNPVGATLGELWCTFVVEFFKPVIPTTPINTQSYHAFRTGVTSAAPLGTTVGLQSGSLNVSSLTSTTFTFLPSGPSSLYEVSVIWYSNVTSAATIPNPTISGGTSYFILNNDGAPYEIANNGSITDNTSGTHALVWIIKASAVANTPIVLTFGAIGSSPTWTGVDLLVAPLDSLTVL